MTIKYAMKLWSFTDSTLTSNSIAFILFKETRMLMYSSYRKVEVHDRLVEDVGPHLNGFQDIRVLQHLCAKATGHGVKVYFVDESEVMDNVYEKIYWVINDDE